MLHSSYGKITTLEPFVRSFLVSEKPPYTASLTALSMDLTVLKSVFVCCISP